MFLPGRITAIDSLSYAEVKAMEIRRNGTQSFKINSLTVYGESDCPESFEKELEAAIATVPPYACEKKSVVNCKHDHGTQSREQVRIYFSAIQGA